MKYEVYGNLGCGYCDLAIDLLEEKDLDYEYFDLHNVQDRQKELMNVAGHHFYTVPQIFIEQHDDRFENERVRKRTYIGVYTQLKEYLEV